MPERPKGTIRVLESVGGVKPTTNPYLAMLIRALKARDDVSVETFSFPRALFGRYDIFHVHWPEVVFGGHRPVGRLARRSLTTLLLARLALTRTPVVRTWHNTERPSGLSWWDHRLLDAFDRRTRVRIRLNDVTELPEDVIVVTIPHGHYRDWYSRHLRHAPVPRRVGYVGLIRRYKGVEDLVAAFRGVVDPMASLHVSGKASSEELQSAISEMASGDDRIHLRFGFVDDADFVREMTESTLVTLPYLHMHNSGTMLAALSLDRPVLVPDNAVNRRLRDEIGPDWVHLFEGTLSPEALERALHAVSRKPPAHPPRWEHREWEEAAYSHLEAFRLASDRRLMQLRRTKAVSEIPRRLAKTEAGMEPPRLTVAILTFRRPAQLVANLEAVIAGVREAKGLVNARILVVDNDPDASARGAVPSGGDISVDYVHEPRPGIPVARNRALEESSGFRLLAFIDDDEIPQAGWLTSLVTTWQTFDADAVMGRVVSALPANADPWAVAGEFFSRPNRLTGTSLTTAATGNLLLDLDTVRRTGIHFDESLGLGGGEDSVFTTELTRAGGRIVWCQESVALDPVSPERATREWIRRRAFAQGNVLQHTRQRLASTTAERWRTRAMGFVGGGARMLQGAFRMIAGIVLRTLRQRVRGERGILRGAGVLTASVGYHHEQYRRRGGNA